MVSKPRLSGINHMWDLDAAPLGPLGRWSSSSRRVCSGPTPASAAPPPLSPHPPSPSLGRAPSTLAPSLGSWQKNCPARPRRRAPPDPGSWWRHNFALCSGPTSSRTVAPAHPPSGSAFCPDSMSDWNRKRDGPLGPTLTPRNWIKPVHGTNLRGLFLCLSGDWDLLLSLWRYRSLGTNARGRKNPAC